MSIYIPASTRALDIWRSVLGNPFTVAFRKPDGSNVASQIVRLEYAKAVSDAESAAGTGALRKLVIIGVRDHPSQPDCIIGKGYRFNYQGKQYTVLDPVVIPGGGEVQAYCEVVG